MKTMKIPSTNNQISNKAQRPKFKMRNKWSIYKYCKLIATAIVTVANRCRTTFGECFGFWKLKFEIYL
jgi:hypothetical protein